MNRPGVSISTTNAIPEIIWISDDDENYEPPASCRKSVGKTKTPSKLYNQSEKIADDEKIGNFSNIPSISYEPSDEELSTDEFVDDLPTEFIYRAEGENPADFRRLFSLTDDRIDEFKHRKAKLGPFFPPKHPNENSAKARVDDCNKHYMELMDYAWMDSASFGVSYPFLEMRKKIDTDPIVKKNMKRNEDPPVKKEKNPLDKKPQSTRLAVATPRRQVLSILRPRHI